MINFINSNRLINKLLDIWYMCPQMSLIELLSMICGDKRESYITDEQLEKLFDEILDKGEL